MTATGPNDILDFYWEVNGIWQSEPLNESGMDLSQPPLALLTTSSGTPLVATVCEGPDGDVDFYWQVAGSWSWNPEYFANDGFV